MFQNFPWIDEQYINRIGYKLARFVRQKTGLYNCRCPSCGDSKQRADLARGYFIMRDSQWIYYCHNCNITMSIRKFLKTFDENLYDEYSLEIFQEAKKFSPVKEEKKEIIQHTHRLPNMINRGEVHGNIKSISQMSDDHPAKRYVISRKIPPHLHSRLFYAPKFRKWNSPLMGKEYNDKFPDHPRLVIPYYWTDGSIYRYTSRAFGDESPKYQQTIIDSEKPRVYGIDRIKQDKLVYVVEGPIDSLFLPNCLAVGTSNYNVDILNTFPNRVYVPDNQPRNKDVVKQIEFVVNKGFKVCIWKNDFGKDINSMVLGHGFSQEDLIEIIQKSTYSGVEAMLKFGEWRKC